MQPRPLERKLVAILYADVAGYSRLTSEDEEGTHRALSACLDAVTAAIEGHNGKVLHFAGDAVLAEFATVSEAVICAVSIQRDLEERNKDLPDHRKIRFRIGLNLGLEARRMFEAAIELDPRYASAYVGLGWTYRKTVGHGWTEFPHRALQQAHDLAQKALSFEESAAAYRLLGYVYLPRRQYELAGHALERAIELNPNDWDSLAIKGAVQLYTGQPAAAIQAYETALRFNPGMDVDRLFELGLAYYLERRYGDAVSTLEEGVGRNPNHPFLHAALAAAYAEVGRPGDAERAAATVRRLHPFFEAASFGTRFRDPADQIRIADGLRKAGLR